MSAQFVGAFVVCVCGEETAMRVEMGRQVQDGLWW